MQSGAVMISNFLQLFTKSTLNQRETLQMYVTNITGGDPGFLQNTSCIRKPQVIPGGGGAYPLHPPPRSAPVLYGFSCSCIVEIVIILEGNEKEMRNTFKVFNRLNTMVQCICSLFQV